MSGYLPTAGMLRALAGAFGADEADVRACQRRGLMDHRGSVTARGRDVLARQRQRLDDEAWSQRFWMRRAQGHG
jgi:hypothetical protein